MTRFLFSVTRLFNLVGFNTWNLSIRMTAVVVDHFLLNELAIIRFSHEEAKFCISIGFTLKVFV